MRILYGVQATGQGHISRARAMAAALASHDVELTWLFSGRERERLFDMEPFGNFQHRRGLTFATEAGRLRYRATIARNNIFHFLRDVKALASEIDQFDLVVTDYEPVSAWAGQRVGKPVIGIGHQYAFGPDTPVSGDNPVSRWIMQRFAPVGRPLGLHWHPYADNVLPPILDLPPLAQPPGASVLVYLPFEDQAEVTRLLQCLPEHQFTLFGPGLSEATHGNVSHHPPGIHTFKHALANARAVICNSGFELISECLQWRKPVLTRPLARQMEQLSNALALRQLGYAQTLDCLDPEVINRWLAQLPAPADIHFPDVATRLAQWLAAGAEDPPAMLNRELWSRAGKAPPQATRNNNSWHLRGGITSHVPDIV